MDLPTLPQAALLYRLSGDWNPIHADPAAAAAAGFDRPILHGLATYGIACWAIVRAVCAYRPERLMRFDVRFSRHVYPGDTISTQIWSEAPGRVVFRCLVPSRETTVIDNGYAEVEDV